jgi:hypothetical protein
MGATHLHLQTVYRQAADEPFARFLHEVRTTRPSAQRIQDILGACFREHVELESLQLTDNATVLCPHRWGQARTAVSITTS